MEVCVTEEQRVATIADMMRSKGIKKLKVGDLELEMVDAPVEVARHAAHERAERPGGL